MITDARLVPCLLTYEKLSTEEHSRKIKHSTRLVFELINPKDAEAIALGTVIYHLNSGEVRADYLTDQ